MRKLSEAVGDEPTVIDLIRRGRCDLVINTPGGRPRALGRLRRSARRRSSRRVPCITTHVGRRDGGARDRERARRAGRLAPGADRCRDANGVASPPSRRSGRTRCCGSRAAASSPAFRGSSSCSRRRDGCCRGRCRCAWRRPASWRSSSIRSGRGRRRCASSTPGEEIHVFGPLGNGYRLDVDRPLLVGGGIGIAPLPYLAAALARRAGGARLPHGGARRGGRAAARRRGRASTRRSSRS